CPIEAAKRRIFPAFWRFLSLSTPSCSLIPSSEANPLKGERVIGIPSCINFSNFTSVLSIISPDIKSYLTLKQMLCRKIKKRTACFLPNFVENLLKPVFIWSRKCKPEIILCSTSEIIMGNFGILVNKNSNFLYAGLGHFQSYKSTYTSHISHAEYGTYPSYCPFPVEFTQPINYLSFRKPEDLA